GIEQQFGIVVAQTVIRFVGTANAKTVELSGTDFRQKRVPDLTGVFAQRDAKFFHWRINIVEQAKFDRSRVLGNDCEINAVAEPGCAERVWFSGPGLQRGHKARRSLSITPTQRAIRESRNA